MVCVKRVVDFNVRVQVKSDGSGMNLDGVKMSMNPFDEIAVEEAIRKKEAGEATEVIVVSIGGSEVQEQLRSALAMGSDRAILVETDSTVQPLHAAKLLAALVEKESPDLVLMGKQAIDDDCNQTPQMLSALLNWPQATFASEIRIEQNKAQVKREVDAGLETLEVTLPAVISTDLRLNEPRYIKLPDIMKAKKKPLENIAAETLGIDKPAEMEVLETQVPAGRSKGIQVKTTDELVAALKEKGVL